MDYRVVVSRDAKDDLEKYVSYLALEKCNMQAAVNLLDDYDKTIDKLSLVAGNLKFWTFGSGILTIRVYMLIRLIQRW